MLTNLVMNHKTPKFFWSAIKPRLIVLFVTGLAGCATETPIECAIGYVRTSATACAPLPKAGPKNVDNRPIPYDPKTVDNSPIKLPNGQKTPFEKRIPPSSAMTSEKSTNPFAKTGAQAAPASSN